MNFGLTEKQIELRAKVREFAEKEVKPVAAFNDEHEKFDVEPQFVKRLQFEHFVQAVFDDRITETGGDVLYGSSFAHGLFDFAVHEDRATCAEVVRLLRKCCHVRKITHIVA